MPGPALPLFPVGNMTDNGQHYEYVYDPFGRLRKVLVRDTDPLLTVLVAEYRYNGLGQRITAHFDTNLDTDVDGSDVVSHFAYDARWRIVARYEDANSDPTEQFVFHNAGLALSGSGSYIDAVMLRDRDTCFSGGGNGTLDERVYYLHNWRSDVVALISHAGSQIEQVRYEPYGTPFGMPAGDIDADGKVTQDDIDQATAWYSGSAYDVRADLDMNGSVNLSDLTYIAGNKALNHETGRGVLSLEHIASRKGYAGYENLAELEGSGVKWDVRNRVLLSEIGSWNRRDPLGYVDGMSLYQYVMSFPLEAVDPYGLFIWVGDTDDRIRHRRDRQKRDKEDRKDENKERKKSPFSFDHDKYMAYYKWEIQCGQYKFEREGWERVNDIVAMLSRLRDKGCCVKFFTISAHHNPMGTWSCDEHSDRVSDGDFASAIRLCASGSFIKLNVCGGESLAQAILDANPNLECTRIVYTPGENWHHPGWDIDASCMFDKSLPSLRQDIAPSPPPSTVPPFYPAEWIFGVA